MIELIYEYAIKLIAWHGIAISISILSILLIITCFSWIVNLIAKRYLVQLAQKLVSMFHSKWAEILLRHKAIRKLSHIAPGMVFFLSAKLFKNHYDYSVVQTGHIIHLLSIIYMVCAVFWSFAAFLNAIDELYILHPMSRKHPIRTYTQTIKILFFLCTAIIVIAMLLDKSPLAFFTGLGAAAAIIVLIFKDTILGFVSCIQLTMTDVVRVGDWITIPNYSINGEVTDVFVSTIKVRNFDKTTISIPTHALLTNGVQNWRSMYDAGGRRIKRAIHIDMDTIKFYTKDDLEQLEEIELLAPYLQTKLQQLQLTESYDNNTPPTNNGDADDNNAYALTNISVFRTYANEYLKNNPNILYQAGYTLIVRQLEPTETGLPIELLVFTKDTTFSGYEQTQAEIFEHLLAMLPTFNLRAFQNISNHMPKMNCTSFYNTM